MYKKTALFMTAAVILFSMAACNKYKSPSNPDPDAKNTPVGESTVQAIVNMVNGANATKTEVAKCTQTALAASFTATSTATCTATPNLTLTVQAVETLVGQIGAAQATQTAFAGQTLTVIAQSFTPTCTPTATATSTSSPDLTQTAQAILTILANANATATEQAAQTQTAVCALMSATSTPNATRTAAVIATMTATVAVPPFKTSFTYYNSNRPGGIAVESNGKILITDRSSGYLYEFPAITSTPGYGSSIYTYLSMSNTGGVATGNGGNIYVADTNNNRVVRISPDSYGGFNSSAWGTTGYGDNQFRSPTGILVNSDGNVIVTDTGNGRIQEFTSTGIYIKTFYGYLGSMGDSSFSGLLNPTGITADSDGNIYVADYDSMYHKIRIIKYSADGNAVKLWTAATDSYYYYSSSAGEFYGIACDSANNVYLSVRNQNKIMKFTPDGVFITQWGTVGSNNGQFYTPGALAFDAGGNLYVADTINNRIQVFGW